MTAQTTTPITFDRSHSHPLDAVTGYDVVRTNGHQVIEVVQVVHGATNYSAALTAAAALRIGSQYGYTADRYSCGCRFIGHIAHAVDLTV